MKKILMIISLVLCVLSLSAQNINVVDITNLEPIYGVHIYGSKNKEGVKTNRKGIAEISIFKNTDTLWFSHPSYSLKAYSYIQLKELDFTIKLTEKLNSLEEIVISASKFEESKSDVPQEIKVLTSKDLSFMNMQTSADVMENTGSVFVQKSQMGGGSPVIRGFETNKILLVVDGVRMNNAIYRGGHLQNIITVDNNMMDKIEVVYGPSSVIYGSDALGGVIHFFTKTPELSLTDKTAVSSRMFTRYSSAYNEKTGHVDVNIGFKKVGLLTSITYSDFGDLRQGNIRNPFYGDYGKRDFYVQRINGIDSTIKNPDVNLQVGTGYKQYDVMQKILVKHSDNVSSILNFQYSTSSDVPRYDRLTQVRNGAPRYGEWYYGPQERLLASYNLLLKGSSFYDNARITLAYQKIEESRHDRGYRKDILNSRTENLDIFSINADFEKEINKHELRYGIEGVYNTVQSSAFYTNIKTNETGKLDTRYPDGGSYMQTMAAYLTHTYEFSDKLILNEGVRFTNVVLNSKFVDTTFFPFPFKEVTQNNFAPSGNIGLVYKPSKSWRFNVVAASGFRAPNVDDLSKVFESVPGNVIVPNPNLKPEYTYNLDFGIAKTFNDKVVLGGTAYYTIYNNAITTQPFLFDGKDSIEYQGIKSAVIANVNANEAYLFGFNAYVEANITENFSINSTVTYTYGRIKTDTTDYPLDHIPPVFGKTSMVLKLNKFKGEFYVLYNNWKREKDYNKFGEDNFSTATPYGMPAWITLNLRADYQISKTFKVQVALNNILDQNYRVFASGISAPGRNLILTLRANI